MNFYIKDDIGVELIACYGELMNWNNLRYLPHIAAQ